MTDLIEQRLYLWIVVTTETVHNLCSQACMKGGPLSYRQTNSHIENMDVTITVFLVSSNFSAMFASLKAEQQPLLFQKPLFDLVALTSTD